MFRILIIEYNIKLRKQIKRLLKSKLSYLSVAEASDESETFLEIKKNRPDMVLMDIRIAGENGLDLIKKIKMRYPFMPIAINTNKDSPEYKTAAFHAGADYFFSKKSNTIIDLVLLTESIFLGASADISKTHEIC
jgi:DNA-binding NarL/FixJ family response regulator